MASPSSGGELSIESMNQMNREVFVHTLGWLFEDSPWVAWMAWESLPFTSREELLQTMIIIVQKAEEGRKLALLRAHPDLGTRLQCQSVPKRNRQA